MADQTGPGVHVPGETVYRHTQTSRLWLLGTVLTAVIAVVTLAAVEGPVVGISLVAFAVVLVVVVLGGRLTVTVDAAGVRAAFGWGWPGRRVLLSDIVSAQPVRNRAWYGWGIRVIPQGWMFNVWGLDAVELRLASGRLFRIGTDEPEQLADAIEAARASIVRP